MKHVKQQVATENTEKNLKVTLNELILPPRLCEIVVDVADVILDIIVDVIVDVVDVLMLLLRLLLMLLMLLVLLLMLLWYTQVNQCLDYKDTLMQTLFPMLPKVQTSTSSEQNLSYCVL